MKKIVSIISLYLTYTSYFIIFKRYIVSMMLGVTTPYVRTTIL